MTTDFRRWVYELLQSKPEEFLFDGEAGVKADRKEAWRRMGIVVADDICSHCMNRLECPFKSQNGRDVYRKCNFYKRRRSK